MENWQFRACPRCKDGDVYQERIKDVLYNICIQCGHRWKAEKPAGRSMRERLTDLHKYMKGGGE